MLVDSKVSTGGQRVSARSRATAGVNRAKEKEVICQLDSMNPEASYRARNRFSELRDLGFGKASGGLRRGGLEPEELHTPEGNAVHKQRIRQIGALRQAKTFR